MPDHKNQHYVPRCVLKPFTLDGDGKAINLYSFGSDKLIRCAPVKNQCARDYFYGADGQLESALAQVEGHYATALRRVAAGTEADDDLDLLRFFAYLQLRRTEIAIQRVKEAGDAMLIGVPEDVMPPDTIENIMISSLNMCVEMQPLISDLKVRIVENRSNLDFVTSDDPAVSTNKWMCQKSLESEGFGTMSSGFILVMPLTPRLALLCYDGLVYTIPTLKGGRVILKSDNDVVALNELQYLKAAANIYFSSWDDREYVRSQYSDASPRRITDWFITRHYILVDGKTDVWKEVTEEETHIPNGRSIVRSTFLYPVPSSWVSHLKYRNPVRTFSNGTMAGHVRKEEWLTENPIKLS